MASVKAIAATRNTKLGPGWGATYRQVGPTCPPCPLLQVLPEGRLKGPCYAASGRVRIQSIAAAHKRAHASNELRKLDGCGRVRWDVSGDNFDKGEVDENYIKAKYAWHKRNPGSTSLGYTHGPSQLAQAGYGPSTFPDNYNLLASCHGLRTSRKLRESGWRTARVVLDEKEPIDDCEHYCPVDKAKHEGRPAATTCAVCRLCWGQEHQEKSIVFIQF